MLGISTTQETALKGQSFREVENDSSRGFVSIYMKASPIEKAFMYMKIILMKHIHSYIYSKCVSSHKCVPNIPLFQICA